MNILITGGAGYKGTLLTEALLRKGHHVTVLDNFLYGSESLLHLAGNSGLSVISRDVRNDIGEFIRDKDVIFHLAGISGYPACEANPHSAKLINVDATRQLVRCLGKGQLLIYASTTSFYGKSGTKRDEDSTVEPVSTYGLTKYRAEQICLQEHECTIAPRFPTLFGVGTRMRIDLLCNDFVYRAVTERCVVVYSGKAKRTFLHVRDAVAGYVFCMEHADAMLGRVFNIGSDALNCTKLELARMIRDKTGCEIIDADMDDPDVRNYEIDYRRIQSLGYRPSHSLSEGVDELARLYGFYRPTQPYNPI